MPNIGAVAPQSAEIDCRAGLDDLHRVLRRPGCPSILLDGSGGFENKWSCGPLLAVEARRIDPGHAGFDACLLEIDRRVRERRRWGGSGDTGVAMLVSYEAPAPAGPRDGSRLPGVVAFSVDGSVRLPRPSIARVTLRADDAGESARRFEALVDTVRRAGFEADAAAPLRLCGKPRTSLPREAYLRAVESVRDHIARGDIYQANLCQQFQGRCRGDAFELYRGLNRAAPAPRSAFLETDRFALVSISPEMFLSIDGDRVETQPIKGTRPRGASASEDRAAIDELLGSSKDRAELLMIVDLERNDLGRVCRTGTVQTPELTALRSFATVHHLVARVRGRLKAEVDLQALLRATFPGGSITGAPKIRAMEILRELEPCARGYFTGSLFWFGDDGTTDSSILIRTLTVADGRFYLGAGGGVVADSDPEAEWRESNLKARAPARALGFDPEEAR